MPRRLIVTADDVGLDAGMTAGAIRAHREGTVTACSVVANGAAFDDAVARLREVPSLEVGVHLSLVEERPLTAIRFPKHYAGFVLRYLAGAIGLDAIERELRAQIERVAAAGLRITHLNGHQHLHALPALFALTVRLAEEYGIGYVRLPRDLRVSGDPVRAASIALLTAIAQRARRRVCTTIAMNDVTIGITEAGRLAESDLYELLALVGDGVTELVTHPGVNVGGYRQWRYAWDAETRLLCDPALREELAVRGIELVAPSQLTSLQSRG